MTVDICVTNVNVCYSEKINHVRNEIPLLSCFVLMYTRKPTLENTTFTRLMFTLRHFTSEPHTCEQCVSGISFSKQQHILKHVYILLTSEVCSSHTIYK